MIIIGVKYLFLTLHDPKFRLEIINFRWNSDSDIRRINHPVRQHTRLGHTYIFALFTCTSEMGTDRC